MMVWEKGRITPMVLWSWFIIVLVIALVPSMCIVGFARWIGRQKEIKFEEKVKAWQVFVSLTSAMTALVGGGLLTGKYVAEQTRLEGERLDQSKRELNFKKAESLRQEIAYWQQKQDQKRKLYDEVEKLATHLAELKEVDQIKKSPERSQFEQMYWAQLIGVEGPEVEAAMG